MSADNVFAGSIPALYDQYLGSLLFQPYARDIADRLSYLTEGRLLETAAGTGIVTRALGAALSNQVQIVALNQPGAEPFTVFQKEKPRRCAKT